jgi:dTMP kinase
MTHADGARKPWDGLFIVLEGIDGSGTTTHSKRLAKALRAKGVDTRLTCEPTNGPIGMVIRQVLQNRLIVAYATAGPRPFAWSTMALLFAADRLDHLDAVVVPALRSGATVVSDRYYLSSLAYQSVTAPAGESVIPWIREINGYAVRPDLTIVLDIDADKAQERRVKRGGMEELFEGSLIQERLASVYRHAQELVTGDRLETISAEGTIEEVGARILGLVSALYEPGSSPPAP